MYDTENKGPEQVGKVKIDTHGHTHPLSFPHSLFLSLLTTGSSLNKLVYIITNVDKKIF